MASVTIMTPKMMWVWGTIVTHYREEIDDCNIKNLPFSKQDIRKLTNVSQTTFNKAWKYLVESRWITLINQQRCNKPLYIIHS